MPSVQKSSVCPHDCPSTCALSIEVIDGARIGSVRGAAENSYTAGVICNKVAHYRERVHHPDRLTRPLLRTGPKGSGQFRPIPWEEALDRIAERFIAETARLGSEAVWPFYYAGTMGLVQRDGIHRLRHEMKYSRQRNTICTALAEIGWMAGVGVTRGPDPREMEKSDLVVMWGGNPVSTQVNVMTHVSRARKERGAQFVVIDPYRTPTAAVADMHLAPRPGTDAALACAVMHIAFRDGYADRDYMARYTDCPDALEAHLRARGPDWASAITGIPVERIEAFGRLYGQTRRSYIRCGYGFTRSRNGAAAMHAVVSLPSVTGAWQHEGGGALWSNRSIYKWNKTLIEGLDVRDTSIRELDMSRIASVLTNDKAALKGGPPVTAMLIQNQNPVTVCPDSNRVRRGFGRDDLFVATHEQFLTETARWSDIVLPATMFMEHDDLYQAGGHSHIQIGPKLIEPPGECRSNHEVLQGLAGRLGATHRGFSMTAWEIIDETLRISGWPDAKTVLEKRWIDVMPPFETAHFIDGFGAPDKRYRFAPDWKSLGDDHALMPKLPDHLANIDAATADAPFRLVTAPARSFLNTSFTEMPYSRKREVRPTVLVNPDDAVRFGMAEGTKVRLGNARGEVVLHVRIGAEQQPGVLVAESIWPSECYEGGIGINALTSDEPGPPWGGAVFHDTAVWLRVEAAELPLAAE
ncbi:MAG TPA: molybdopterin oxidoreductase family protein [Rhodopila sp.]|uniref:molybdopterin oxidoreductase family protein n=1 Tax=Rhodopila sp. TaxID=2480087 RepID=UPI002CC2EBCF|nr:molybdopterin oxidoreductase family protein [Rhodopila sp.]HVY14603.1 molybdopterin oxidoreductase family protein [Rhodopila sp.]